MDDQSTTKLMDLMKSFRTALLLTIGDNGAIRARPMAVLQVEDGGSVWFMTNAKSLKVEEIEKNPRVSVALQRENATVSLMGHATVSRDKAKIDELWNVHAQAFFPKGKDDPEILLVKVIGHEAEYWDTEGLQGIKYMFEVAKALVTGNKPEMKDDKDQHGQVQLNETVPQPPPMNAPTDNKGRGNAFAR